MAKLSTAVRRMVAEWPADAPYGAVERFCAEHAISRSWFYKVRARARVEGVEAALTERSRRPSSSPQQVSDHQVALVLATCRALQTDGLEAGPLSVLDALSRAGHPALPSRSTVARILAAAGLSRPSPRKRPKSSYKRFAMARPNQRWQIDAFDYELDNGQSCTIYEVLDDCTRKILAAHVASAETTQATIAVLAKAITAWGRPLVVHSDNSAAINPLRRGMRSEVVTWLADQGIHTLTGRSGHPRTQGKVERSHQGHQKYLAAHPCATPEQALAVLDAYAERVNNRSHQSLPPRTSPNELYDQLDKAVCPGVPFNPYPSGGTIPAGRTRPGNSASLRVSGRSLLHYHGVRIVVDVQWIGQTLHVIESVGQLEIFDPDGTFLYKTPWPTAQHRLRLVPKRSTSPKKARKE